MSENREASENIKIDETEKIDIMGLVSAFLNGLRRLWVLLLVIVIVCTLRSYFSTSFSYTPQYVASATVSVTTPGESYTNIQSAQEMAEMFPYVLTSGVLREVIQNDMGLDYLPGQISVDAEEGMNMLTISVSSDDPQMAYNILQSVIKNYPEVAEYIFGETQLQILDETGIPSDTQEEVVIRGSYRRGALQGLIVSAVILCLYVLLKRTVRTKEQVKKQINIRDLGSLPYVKQKKRKNAENNTINILNERIAPVYEEAIRRLRIRIMRESEMKNAKVIMVTSSVPGEGKTTVAVNLAIAIAKQKKSVILVDCDMRNPSVAQMMHNDEANPGLASVLKDETTLQYGGAADSEDTALLGSRKMGEVIEELKGKADYVILDTAPAELLVDASLLAKYVDAALYVIRCDYTKMNKIRGGIETLASRRLDILGFVFNGDLNKKESRYGYGYGYGYGRYGG